MNRPTDWDLYYQARPITTSYSRPILHGAFFKVLRTFSEQNPVIAELGGGASTVFDGVLQTLEPSAYYVVDTNQHGLDLLRSRVRREKVYFLNRDVLKLDLPVPVDTIFSLGLIEHFDPAGTREAVLSHLRPLKVGGIAIISFPSPTISYRALRALAEAAGSWIFHDERPLWPAEVEHAIQGRAGVRYKKILWPMILTQTIMVIRKNR